ncbi:hypothetical protein [Acrocarpospora catenulata]|uniref:hypothetical protein n=1 Tax=Acrocarpospora catenulata TaxID=2836182 RepID=UPI001BDA7795|nr:hypothetical protein [Acrocarpospora catenulata]
MTFVAGSFQNPFGLGPALLAGTIRAELTDTAGGPPPAIFEANAPFQVNFEWELNGALAPLIGGSWQLRVLVDEIGGPFEAPFPTPPLAVPLTGVTAYAASIVIGGLPGAVGGRSYAIIASLTYLNVAGTPSPMGGFVPLGVVAVVG